jgi:predicted phage terminase large subunit-like protein
VNKDTQEFHEERFRYYTDDQKPKQWRIFTTCDPAFSKRQEADNTAIITGMFDGMDMYILEYSYWKRNPAELIDKLIYHKNKRNPEKIGIESFQAQVMIWFNLRAELERRWQFVTIEEIRQTGDKNAKIRSLIPLYRNGHIYHKIGMDVLEMELKRFPRWKHDDIIDSCQMLYSMYSISPNNKAFKDDISIKYDEMWRPIMVWYDEDDIY